jgi:4-alpha-glucanotransferase
MNAPTDQLSQLADLYGINTGYLDTNGLPKAASVETIFAVLKALGTPLSGLGEVPAAIREKHQRKWQQPLEPVIVFRDNNILTLKIHLPETLLKTWISASLVMENGEQRKLHWRCDDSFVIHSAWIEKIKYVTVLLCVPERLPIGYHRLYLELPGQVCETLIVSAPLKAYSPPTAEKKIWGVFLPLYALHTRNSWGAGDFADLETLMEYVSQLGGNMLGTLPLLPSFFDEQLGPSPYLPASRLFWNEFYLDILGIPELEKCASAQAMINSTDFKNELKILRKSRFVEYSHQLSLKRKILEKLSEHFFREKPARFSDFEAYLHSNSSLESYARFRAAGEKHGLHWLAWPQAMRDGDLREEDYFERNRQYYLYTQWLAREQIRSLSEKAAGHNLNLYLDLPVGVHPYSFDVWRNQETFVTGICVGAPPDPVFTSGQNWSFPPLHPEKIRQQGYQYIIDSLRHQLDLARMLRVDHIMHFNRLFWIPEGMENREGLYVNYRPEELFAILALESYRHQSIIVGEDLGMVPAEVRPAMKKHGVLRTFVGQYQLTTENQMGKIPSHCVASLNTHDMFPFAAFWEGKDISERLKLKLLDDRDAEKEREQRREMKNTIIKILQLERGHNGLAVDSQTAFNAILNLMSASPAYAFLLNLEDLWQETHAQNVPGTLDKQNWSRKTRYGFESLSLLPQITELLCNVDRIRKER